MRQLVSCSAARAPAGSTGRSASATTARPTAAVLLRPSVPRGKTTPCGWCCSSVLIGPSCPPATRRHPPRCNAGLWTEGTGCAARQRSTPPRKCRSGVRRGPALAHTSGVHTGDAEERELFERLEREFAHVRAPRRRDRRAAGRAAARPGCCAGAVPRRLATGCSPGSSCCRPGSGSSPTLEGGRSLLAPLVAACSSTPVAPGGDGEFVFTARTPSVPVRWTRAGRSRSW